MSEAHVPPQACGNNGRLRERAQWTVAAGGARVGRWQNGGLSVYGLCRDCNGLTSARDDPAYTDFHQAVSKTASATAARLGIDALHPPVRVAPGLVARSILAGMFAINNTLQDLVPDVATALRLGGPLRLPDELQLKLAFTPGPDSRLGGPVGYMKVLGYRLLYLPFADVWFPPLAWSLSSARAEPNQLGPSLTADWADVSEWTRYGPDLITDLRNLTRPLPLAQAPRFGAEEWMLLSGDTMTALEGRPRFRH